MATNPAPIPQRAYSFTAPNAAVGDFVSHELNTIYGVLQGAVGTQHLADNAGILRTQLASGVGVPNGVNLLTGWNAVSDTWTYASATTITVPTGAASVYAVGDRIMLTQTTVKYFYVEAVADTLLTINGGTDYTLANAAITSPSYSKVVNPIGFPSAFNFTSTYTGFSANPSQIIRFSLIGKQCLLSVYTVSAGTSNANNFIMTLPFTSADVATNQQNIIRVSDNGSFGAGFVYTTQNTKLLTVCNGLTGTANTNWTTSGNKYASFQFTYEVK